MMAAHCKSQCFLNQRLSFRQLCLVVIMICLFSVTESAAPIMVKGQVGGNVTIPCIMEGTVEFFYLQRDQEFVNGYHSTWNLTDFRPWTNTRLGEDNRSVHMYNLNMSHSGYYECHVKYFDREFFTSKIHLNVTAKFTKPEVKINCVNGLSCMVTCSSYNGYPENKMSWSVPGSVTWKVVNTSMTPDQKTMMINSSSTAYFNCSNGQLNYIKCSVGEVNSDMFTVCKLQPPTENPAITLAIGISALVAIGIGIVALLLFWRFKKRGTGAVPSVKQEWGVNGQKEEEVELNNKTP